MLSFIGRGAKSRTVMVRCSCSRATSIAPITAARLPPAKLPGVSCMRRAHLLAQQATRRGEYQLEVLARHPIAGDTGKSAGNPHVRRTELLVGARPGQTFLHCASYLVEPSITEHASPTRPTARGALRLDQSPWACRVGYEGDPESSAELRRRGGLGKRQGEQLEPCNCIQYPIGFGLVPHADRAVGALGCFAAVVASMRLTASAVVHSACARNRQLMSAA
jgi:hypothetical protein